MLVDEPEEYSPTISPYLGDAEHVTGRFGSIRRAQQENVGNLGIYGKVLKSLTPAPLGDAGRIILRMADEAGWGVIDTAEVIHQLFEVIDDDTTDREHSVYGSLLELALIFKKACLLAEDFKTAEALRLLDEAVDVGLPPVSLKDVRLKVLHESTPAKYDNLMKRAVVRWRYGQTATEEEIRAFYASSERIGCFTKLNDISQGGQGAVMKVAAGTFGALRVYALKRYGGRREDEGSENDFDVLVALSRRSSELATASSAQGEIDVLKQLKNLHVSGWDFPFLVEHFREDGAEHIVMELLRGGSLQDVIESGDKEVIEAGLESWTRQMFTALVILQMYGIVHGDIKPHNILMRDGCQPMGAVLADFGGSATSAYKAPEVVAGERRSQSSDVWSMGATVVDTGLFVTNPIQQGSLGLEWRRNPSEKGSDMLRETKRYNPRIAEICWRALLKDPTERATALHLWMRLNC
eukprot:Hpha_TRINITY_DN4863_c0_g1::TRINITY_DN4863_c0_g1_i1::g.20377::m.20377